MCTLSRLSLKTFKNQVYKTKYKLLHLNVTAAILDSQNALEVVT